MKFLNKYLTSTTETIFLKEHDDYWEIVDESSATHTGKTSTVTIFGVRVSRTVLVESTIEEYVCLN